MVTWRVAAAQYPIEALASWDAYERKIRGWVADAAEQGAALAIFPEYGAMELASLDPSTSGDLAGSLEFVASLLPRVDSLHAELAQTHGIHLLAASAPRRDADGKYRNAARLFAPGGGLGTQDKLIMTRFEREQWAIAPGMGLTVFDTALGRLAILICYDCEFPLLARAAIAAGAQLLLVPSCTDTLHGYWRVRLGAQARALEGQCFVVQSPTVGLADWSPAVDVNRGRAGVYSPPDGPFPDDGVLAAGSDEAPGWVCADLDFALIDQLRADGSVLNVVDWGRQPGCSPPFECQIVPLS